MPGDIISECRARSPRNPQSDDLHPGERECRSYRARVPGGANAVVIIPPGPLKVMVATKPVDFRKGAIGLAALVEHELASKPFSGVAWVFRSKRANRIKLLVWDGSGLVLASPMCSPLSCSATMKIRSMTCCPITGSTAASPPQIPRSPKPHEAPVWVS
ncbi:transposase [Sphingomonas populi]|uniref:Transposase n=1 Tax=Sphingomonas populi TaxID=2484750 RepID=A0A4V2DCY0_9SPHN|nr:transposase [Sphingomonas populi]